MLTRRRLFKSGAVLAAGVSLPVGAVVGNRGRFYQNVYLTPRQWCDLWMTSTGKQWLGWVKAGVDLGFKDVDVVVIDNLIVRKIPYHSALENEQLKQKLRSLGYDFP